MGIKVLIVDDSAFMRVTIAKMLSNDVDIEVVGTARNGLDALKRIEKLQPDVITMDIEMPELDGIATLKQLMADAPRPVIMLSSHTAAGADLTMQALQCGAVDFMTKPVARNIEQTTETLVGKVKAAASAVPKIIESGLKVPQQTPDSKLLSSARKVSQILAMGTSTGGPQALSQVLRQLPGFIPCPILVVQHMPPKFTKALANRLDAMCNIHVVEAVNNQVLANGTAYIAPGDFHMQVVRDGGEYLIQLNQGAKRHEHRPSVDVLFESLARLRDVPRHLVLMTGMGNDGAAGMLLAKQSGATTIAESQQTCVVYGMPKAAIALECVDYVLPLHQIGQKLVDVTNAST
ncbi:protein-glutamate methylesterase/protein-glutamine glutaminase [Alicyclobacillus mengziensis]|uniref:Protein-glutamate methylesterase/protein-glutamine glutaminase n=1 Tax=Alicyclobacillus mengziensis TaxID=2931921 RepID=A0A9X7VY79_9BACL|nr:chemotaxis response regulator protein-glutamate methylesterase [Alicyclobacillus mengziensis]QSO47226.1 chemotaxis response regulator protein-glutamate methylesterase [Alicyclobacillus mengziensis]